MTILILTCFNCGDSKNGFMTWQLNTEREIYKNTKVTCPNCKKNNKTEYFIYSMDMYNNTI